MKDKLRKLAEDYTVSTEAGQALYNELCVLFNVSDSDNEETEYMNWWYNLSDHETDRIIIDSGVRKPIRDYDVKNLHSRYR